MTKIVSTIVLFFAYTAYAQTGAKDSINNSAAETEEWKKTDFRSYSIEYPVTWTLNELCGNMTNFCLFSPVKDGNDEFSENVNLIVQDVGFSKMNLDQYTQISLNQLEYVIPNSKLIESRKMKGTTGDYQKVLYTGDYNGFHLEFEQYYWVIGDNAYVLSFTCEESEFSDYQATGERILNSFLFKK